MDAIDPYNISEIGDVLGIACRTAVQFGPWWSFSGNERGVIDDALGVVNNFPRQSSLNDLATRQINAVINTGGSVYIKGSFSGQQNTSRKSFTNVVGLLIYIKKALRPTLEKYLERPNDFKTFKDIYTEVYPFLEGLKGGDKRALVDYSWNGDQFANTDADLVVNTRSDLDQGKYKVKLYLKEVVSLQQFSIDIISAASGVDFSDNA
jgi:hypothetical protein